LLRWIPFMVIHTSKNKLKKSSVSNHWSSCSISKKIYTYKRNKKKWTLYILFFLKQQILLNNLIPAQDEQRSVKLSIQTKGTVYRRNTRNKHPKKHPWGQHPPKFTPPSKNKLFHGNNHCKNDIPHCSSSLLTSKQKTPLKTELPTWTPKLSHPRKNSNPKDHSASTTVYGPFIYCFRLFKIIYL